MSYTERETTLNNYKKFIRIKSIYYIINLSIICCANSFFPKGILSFMITCFGILFAGSIAEKHERQYSATVVSINKFIDENPYLKKEIKQHKVKSVILMILLTIMVLGLTFYLLYRGFTFISYVYIAFVLIITSSTLLLLDYVKIKMLRKHLL